MNKYKELNKQIRRDRAIEKGCTNKKSYPTKESAICKTQDVYRCPNCGNYHRTTRTKKIVTFIKNK